MKVWIDGRYIRPEEMDELEPKETDDGFQKFLDWLDSVCEKEKE